MSLLQLQTTTAEPSDVVSAHYTTRGWAKQPFQHIYCPFYNTTLKFDYVNDHDIV